MIDPHLRLRHLRCFLETARLESLSAAAEALHLSQPAASKTIKELEEILGVQLFDRSGRRLALTAAGRLFQQHAGAAFAGLERAQALVQQAPAEKLRLSVGILPTVASEVFPTAALAFQKTHPDALLRVTTGPNWLLFSQLREGKLDLVVGRMPAPERMTGLAFRQLYDEEVVIVARPDHPLHKTRFRPKDLADYPLMLPPSGAVIHPSVRAYLTSHALHTIEPIFETVSLAFGRKILQRSDAIWMISQGVVADEVAAGTLTILPLQTTIMAGPVGVCYRDTNALPALQIALIEALVQVTGSDGSQEFASSDLL